MKISILVKLFRVHINSCIMAMRVLKNKKRDRWTQKLGEIFQVFPTFLIFLHSLINLTPHFTFSFYSLFVHPFIKLSCFLSLLNPPYSLNTLSFILLHITLTSSPLHFSFSFLLFIFSFNIFFFLILFFSPFFSSFHHFFVILFFSFSFSSSFSSIFSILYFFHLL